MELARHKELVGSQAAAVAHLERQLAAAAAAAPQRSPNNSLVRAHIAYNSSCNERLLEICQ